MEKTSLHFFTVCVPGCGRCSCNWRRCGCHCSSCYKRIRDPICVAANVACEALKAPIKLALKGAREALRGVSNSLNVAKKAFRVAEQIADAASRGLAEASDALEEVKEAFADGISLLGEIAGFGIRNMLNIEEIRFNARLESVNSGQFQISVEARILGSKQRISLDINLRNIVGTITRPLARKIGIGKLLEFIE